MMRLNLALLAAVLVSAFSLVHTQYESRRLYTAIDQAKAQALRLAADHEQLQVQQREQATSARVQQLAVRHLNMHPVNPAITQYVVQGSARVPPAGATPPGGRP